MAARRARGPTNRGEEGRRRDLPGSDVSERLESGAGDALPLDAEPVSGLHPRLPLLLCPPLSDPARDGAGRRLLVGHPGEAELPRGAPPGNDDGTESRTYRAGNGNRPIPAGRRTLPIDPAHARSHGRASGSDGAADQGPLIVRDVDLLADLSQRTECSVHVSIPTVDEDAWRRLEPGNRPSPTTARRRAHARRCGCRRRGPDGADRARHQLAPGQAGIDHSGHRRPWGGLCRIHRAPSRGGHSDPLLRVPDGASIPTWSVATVACTPASIRPAAMPDASGRRSGC